MNQRDTLYINQSGRLIIGGCDAGDLAREFSTPLYVMDEAYIENAAAEMKRALNEVYPDSLIAYASKAFACKAMYGLVSRLGLGADVASGGELYTALSAGFNPKMLYFHGNNKTAPELDEAVKAEIHAVVIDSLDEITALNAAAAAANKKQGVLIRVNPLIEADTHRFIQTACVDSKFGFSIENGAGEAAVKKILAQKNLQFLGIHCHIGSQIFDIEFFTRAVDKMTDFIAALTKSLGVSVRELNMGGGFGVAYTASDTPPAAQEFIRAIAQKLKDCIAQKKIAPPRLIVEPGRSLAAQAGVTLYTVGAVKDIPNVKKYVAVDGGMFENPRYALYNARYEVALALKAHLPAADTVCIAGKCCESGDIIVGETALQKAEKGDLLAVFCTGAYNYSMASNYNRNPIPPVVLCKNGSARYMVKPQTYPDIIARDCDYAPSDKEPLS
ncbi:MAG: diaminopimelate decarboxylase [Firmicutes bacterium]|nr:diaminopimelate decarboxylase [Bacillota bacterium]